MSRAQVTSNTHGDRHFAIGRSLDSLPLAERQQLSGLWIAVELYSAERLPLRVVQAIGSSPGACIQQLRKQGLDPSRFEYELVPQPFPA